MPTAIAPTKRCMNELCIEPSKVSRTKTALDVPRARRQRRSGLRKTPGAMNASAETAQSSANAATRQAADALQRGRPRFRRFAFVPTCGAIERLQRLRPVEMDHHVELRGQARIEIVAPALGLGSIDDADGALELRPLERASGLRLLEIDPERRVPAVMERALVALRKAGSDPLALYGRVPVGRRGHGALVRGETDRER